MPILHLMVGLPGSGKITRAKAIGTETGALRLTLDEWHIRLFEDDHRHPDHDRRHGAVEALMWEVAAAVLRLGGNVILDFGFWSRKERDEARAWAAELGAAAVVHYAPVPHDELVRRVQARRAAWEAASGVGEFAITEADLVGWAVLFQPPVPGEPGWDSGGG